MYNGVGILTPRGTGTSGYVQANKFNLRRAPTQRTDTPQAEARTRQPNKEIIDHKVKRQVELLVLQEQERLEDEGYVQD